MSSSVVALPSVASVASCFDVFRQKLYLRGVLGKKNDRAGDGRPYSMRKWTRWYVELRGPVLVFWNLLDTQLSAYLEDITTIVDGRVQPDSPEFERTVAHIKNIVIKPNFINITDAACSIVGRLKKRDSVWTLHSSGANRFYMQAVDDRAMNEWVRALRLACFEAAKLYEYYSSALVNERYLSVLSTPRSASYQVQVRFSGTNEWAPCAMELSKVPVQLTFFSQENHSQLAVMKSPRNFYAIYPDSLESVNTAVIAKIEGDCDVDASLYPKIEESEDEPPVATSRTHGSYALVLFQSPGEMVAALAETADRAKLYRMPGAFLPDVAPNRENLYLSISDVADKSVEIMEPVTARRMMDNLASERCRRLGSSVHSAGNSTSESTAVSESMGAGTVGATAQTRMPWDSDDDGADEASALPAARSSRRETAAKPAKAVEPEHEPNTESETQTQKRHFRFLHRSDKSKDSGRRDSASPQKESSSATAKHLKRQSKINSTATASSATSAVTASTRDSQRSSANESTSRVSTAPSLPTQLPGSATRGTFADEASEAIVNLKIVDSPPAATKVEQAPARQLAESDSESDSDEPLGDIVNRNLQNVGAMPHNMMAQQQQMQHPMSMYRASSAMPALGGTQQMMGMQQPNMMAPMAQHTQSMYGGAPGALQMYPHQQQQVFGQDPAQMMGGQMMGASGMPVPFQGPGSVRGRPTTYMDAMNGGGMWGQQSGMMGMGMDSVGGPLLTVEKKADPIERPTGLVGAIANREQLKSEQKYRDSSSLMRERQIRRNQAMGMTNPMYGQTGFGGVQGARMSGAIPTMYGQPQGWGAADDTMSMMSGMHGRAPYAQMAPSLSAEQLSGPHMRGTMYGGVQMAQMGVGTVNPAMMGGAGAYAANDDDVALSVYAGGRMSMATPDVHPLRAAMQSGMSVSSPHLAGQLNMYNHQQQLQQQMQMQMMQQQQQQAAMGMGGMQFGQQPGMFGADQQRRMSVAGVQRSSMAQSTSPTAAQSISPGAAQVNAVHSRHSLASSNSGSGGSSGDSSPLALQNRLPANRWVKESSSLRIQSGMHAADARSSTVPRQRNASGSGARGNITSVYELPGRSTTNRNSDLNPHLSSGSSKGRHANRYSSQSDVSDDDADDSDGSDSETSMRGKTSKDLQQFFDVFVDKCLDVKPYAWLDFNTAHRAYKDFCSRNGMRGKDVATTSQFKGLMNAAEWQLKTKGNGSSAYYNACLIIPTSRLPLGLLSDTLDARPRSLIRLESFDGASIGWRILNPVIMSDRL
ncbi:hypothetical protein H4S08_002001 [Coemansia sp. RSA 1365]|nr:hypothetical protein H4S08_002001 [Coemansia sp. RSA 1365]